MKKNILLSCLVLFFGCSSDDNLGENNSKPEIPTVIYKSVQKRLNEGETPISLYNKGVAIDSLYAKKYGGGYIYYLNLKDGSGLVAHSQDNSSAINWGEFGDVIKANSSEIGSGMSNSSEIMNYYLNKNTAADFCNDLVLNDYSDWYLPSKDEMLMMMQRLKNKPNIYFGAVSGYWTSTNVDYNNVWIVKSDNAPVVNLKYSNNQYDIRIRATRKFSK